MFRLQQFWKTDSDSSSFKKPTPTPAENMRLHRLRLHNPARPYVISPHTFLQKKLNVIPEYIAKNCDQLPR